MTAQWIRVPWSGDVVDVLGPLVAGQRARIDGEMSLGTAQAFRVVGDGYRGVCALRFENSPGGLVARAIAVHGIGIEQWAGDFARLAKQAGATAIVAMAESAAHVRLYARLGFEVIAADMRMELES